MAGVKDGVGFRFEGAVGIRAGRDGRPDFSGPLVHGRPGERFVYVTWGVERHGRHEMFRRLKLYLGPLRRAAWEQPGVGWEDLAGGLVEVQVPGALADGTPMCGTCPALWVSGRPAAG